MISFIEMAALITSSSWPGKTTIFQSFMDAVTCSSQVLLFVLIPKNMHVFFVLLTSLFLYGQWETAFKLFYVKPFRPPGSTE